MYLYARLSHTIDMPRKYIRKRRTKKSRVRYSRGTAGRRSLPVVLPDRYTCVVKYAQEFDLEPATATGSDVHVFRANSLYDPDKTGGGHQPYGFDQLCLMFNHFVVVGAQITVQALTNGINNIVPCAWGISLTADGESMDTLSLSWLLETEQTKGTRITGPVAQNTSKWASTQKKNFSLKKFFNKKSAEGAEFQCTSSTNPTEGAFFEVWAATLGADAGPAHFVARINYIITCHEPKLLGQS